MSTDQRHANHHSRNENRSNIREENHEDAEQDQAPERLAIGEGTPEDNNRLIGGAEEVEEEPRGEEAEEEGEGEGVRHEGEPDDRRRDGEVVDLEVGVVLADADGGLGDRLGFG